MNEDAVTFDEAVAIVMFDEPTLTTDEAHVVARALVGVGGDATSLSGILRSGRPKTHPTTTDSRQQDS